MPNIICTHGNAPNLLFRLGISDGWWSVLGRLFQTRSVMGRLWDDHFRDLGHPPKFYSVQDASSGNKSPFWYHFEFILMKNHSEITTYHVFFVKKWLSKKTKRPLPGCWSQSSRVGMHPNPHFQLKPIKNWKNLEIRIPSTIPISESGKGWAPGELGWLRLREPSCLRAGECACVDACVGCGGKSLCDYGLTSCVCDACGPSYVTWPKNVKTTVFSKKQKIENRNRGVRRG